MDQKLKKIMILSGTYIVLMTVLLIGVSTAKYTESTVAYSSFGTAGYNVVLLGKDEATGGAQQFGKTLLAGDLIPGMTYTGNSDTNTAKIFSFQVANGTDGNNVSQIAQDYSIKLRTTRNIPLEYKLLSGSTIYRADGPVALDAGGNPVAEGTSPELDANGIAWYEWTFRDIGNTGDGTLETGVNPVFSLPAGGQVSSNSHSLVVEWPIAELASGTDTVMTNSDKYMKEIELLEVRIQSTQRNNTTEVPADMDVLTREEYSKGFILLDPSKDVQVYQVDYRAFHTDKHWSGDDNSLTYDFTVDSGTFLDGSQTEPIRYKVSVKAPLMWQGESGTGSRAYRCYLWKESRTAEDPYGNDIYEPGNPFAETVYKVNLQDGSREDCTAAYQQNTEEFLTDVQACSADGSKFRYYKEQRYAGFETINGNDPIRGRLAAPGTPEAVYTLETAETKDEETVTVSRGDTFHLELTETGGAAIPVYLQLGGRLEIVIEKVTETAE